MKKLRGNVELGCFFLVVLLFLTIFAFIYDYNRFKEVNEATTKEELETACQEYDMAKIRNVPIKCVKILSEE